MVLVDILKPRAAEHVGDILKGRGESVQSLVDSAPDTRQEVRPEGLRKLEAVAHGVVALQQGVRVVDRAGQVGWVEADKGVDGASVAADGEKFGVLSRHVKAIERKIRNTVLIESVASVPVVWNFLVARGVLEVAVLACDSVKGLQGRGVESTLWVFLTLVGHESVDESPCGRLCDHAGKGSVEDYGTSCQRYGFGIPF